MNILGHISLINVSYLMLQVLNQEESTSTEQLLEFSFTQQKNEGVEVEVFQKQTRTFVSTPKSRSKVAGFAIFVKYRFMDIFQVFPSKFSIHSILIQKMPFKCHNFRVRTL